MVQDAVSPWATFRFALSYPDERHIARFGELFEDAPATLEELRALYIDLFEAGLPHPACPLIEGYYLLNRPAGEVVLENKLFFQHFGLHTPAQASPDHLLTQLEFLCWLDYCIDSGNPDRDSLERARTEYVNRHLAHWVPKAAKSLESRAAPCYAALFQALSEHVQMSVGAPQAG